jgi:hypothetical protein
MLPAGETSDVAHTVAVVIVGLLFGIGFAWSRPKTEPIRLNKDIYTGYYCGFGLTDEGLLGKHFYKVVAKDANCYWEVECTHAGFNRYRAYYPNGKLQAAGEIFVEYRGVPKQPYPDQHKVRNADYYDPNGRIVSSVKNGTGLQVLHYPNGQTLWMLQLKNYQRVEHRMWRIDGKLLSHKVYPQRDRSK